MARGKAARTKNGSDEIIFDMVKMKLLTVGWSGRLYKIGRPNDTIMAGTKPSGPTVRAVRAMQVDVSLGTRTTSSRLSDASRVADEPDDRLRVFMSH